MYSSVENNSGNVPAFLIKLWSLVEDPSTDELIHWDTGGTSFHVYDQQRFSREILPLYFKHNNIASFIRQLNMYGFRKVTHIDQGGLKIEKDDLQFQHQFFQKNERDMLQYIKRKVSNPIVRPVDTVVSSKPDEVSRVLTDVKQVKTKQESLDQNLEYIKRENKLLWREVALLRQKHHKQQQIVNKLIQFLVSLVSSNRSGLTIPGMRRSMPLAIGDSQVQLGGQQAQQTSQVIADPATNNTIASLLQDNLASSGSSIVGLGNTSPFKQEVQAVDDADYIIDEGEYTIESPRGDVLLSPTPNSGGPIIHELTDNLPATGVNVLKNVAPHPILVNSQGQVVAKAGGQQNVILTTNQAASGGGSRTPVNFLVVPQVQVQPQQSASTTTATATILRPVTTPTSAPTSHSRLTSPASFLMSPKIEAAPSLEDALNFGLNVPPSNVSTLGKPMITTAQPKITLVPANSNVSAFTNTRKKRPGESASEDESGSSPAKKPVTVVGTRTAAQPRVLPFTPTSSVTGAGRAAPQGQIRGISPAQAASLNSLVQANSDLNSPVLVPVGMTAANTAVSSPSSSSSLPSVLPSSSSQVPSNNHNNSGDMMALAAAGANKEADDPMLASEQLDLLSSDLDGLKGILQDQYKVDPNFLMELFDMSNPWNLETEKTLEELKADPDKDAASTSGLGLPNITGQELVEYNPQEALFPDLLMGDSLVGDIDDID